MCWAVRPSRLWPDPKQVIVYSDATRSKPQLVQIHTLVETSKISTCARKPPRNLFFSRPQSLAFLTSSQLHHNPAVNYLTFGALSIDSRKLTLQLPPLQASTFQRFHTLKLSNPHLPKPELKCSYALIKQALTTHKVITTFQ